MPHNLNMRWLVHAEQMNLQTRMRRRWGDVTRRAGGLRREAYCQSVAKEAHEPSEANGGMCWQKRGPQKRLGWRA